MQQRIDDAIGELANKADLVIAADFGHGLLGPSSIDLLSRSAPFLAVNCQSNSANLGFNLITKYPHSDYVCIDAPEARLATGDRTSPLGEIARRIEALTGCPKMIITQGKHGCVTYERGGIVHTIPAFAKNVVDTVGAGDAFLSVTSPLVAAGGAMHQVGFIGNVVGALKVEIVGHRRFIEKPDLVKAITGLLK
jgi:sugar/nucleoside kinase (ribokinase family)